ncbi:UPF0149 family protein [Desertibaculum subflavum]|uniref:UPF0149 family protein n=1 Tax=Desertibaculum subflavum TaxID=2268458 RepID=UPI000E66DDD5
MTQSDADLDRLETFLESDRVPEGTMNLSMLDGFLTAVAAGPEVVPPAEWLATIWGEAGLPFADAAEREEVERLILDRQDQIWRDLAGDPPQCTPIYWLTEDNDEVAFDWAEGFMVGVYLRAEAWMPLIGDEAHVDLLGPILFLCEDENGQPLIEAEADEAEALLNAAPDAIPEVVIEIAQFWKEHRPPTEPVRRAGPKVGRNDPCPCGSGKKFKLCCGRN